MDPGIRRGAPMWLVNLIARLIEALSEGATDGNSNAP